MKTTCPITDLERDYVFSFVASRAESVSARDPRYIAEENFRVAELEPMIRFLTSERLSRV